MAWDEATSVLERSNADEMKSKKQKEAASETEKEAN